MGALTVTASANPLGASLGDVDPLEDMGGCLIKTARKRAGEGWL